MPRRYHEDPSPTWKALWNPMREPQETHAEPNEGSLWISTTCAVQKQRLKAYHKWSEDF